MLFIDEQHYGPATDIVPAWVDAVLAGERMPQLGVFAIRRHEISACSSGIPLHTLRSGPRRALR
jgi:hypothetical protein